MKIRLYTAAALLTAALVHAEAQQPSQIETPVFRSAVDAVEIDAFVVDGDGNPVTDLEAADFEVLEDGRPREITSFALVDIPIARRERLQYAPAVIPPDVSTNAHAEGRVYLVAIDELSGPMVPRTRLVLRRFLEEHFAENDSAAIVYVGRGSTKETQDFTTDRRLLLQSVDKLTGAFGSSDLETSHLLDREAEFLLRSRMRSLRSLTEFMANLRGRRKSIIYVSTGLGVSVYEALDYDGGVRGPAVDDLHGAITAATRGNVSIYPIDPGGLTAGDDITIQAVPDPENTIQEASLTTLGRRQDLRALAESTGGFALVDSNSYVEAFDQLVRENSTYYVLGFTTDTDRYDGRFHRVEIRVNRPGIEVRSRNGYLAPMRRTTPIITRASTLAPAVSDALQSPVSVSGVPIRLFAAPYRQNSGEARVAVAMELGVDALGLVERDGRFVGDLAVALRPISSDGKLLEGQRHEAALALKPETYALARTSGVRMLTEMSLPPGRYQLRAAGGPTTGGRAGSVTYDLVVPDFSKGELMLSGVALTSTAAYESVTVVPATRPLAMLDTPITAARDFALDDTVTVYAEVYANGRRPPHTIDVKAELRAADGRVMSRVTAQRSSTEAPGPSGGYSFIAPVPLEDVEPGVYVLRVTATANTASKPTVSKDIQIRVR